MIIVFTFYLQVNMDDFASSGVGECSNYPMVHHQLLRHFVVICWKVSIDIVARQWYSWQIWGDKQTIIKNYTKVKILHIYILSLDEYCINNNITMNETLCFNVILFFALHVYFDPRTKIWCFNSIDYGVMKTNLFNHPCYFLSYFSFNCKSMCK